jgi:hypothetical protein
VSPSAEHPYLQTVPGGGDHAGAVADYAGRPDHDVLPQDHVRLGNTIEQSVINHCARSFPGFFCGLKERNQRASPRVSMLREQSGGSDQPRNVHVMAAGMHDGHGLSLAVGGSLVARIGQTSAFANR